MKRIAIIINENFYDRKGSFNATHARILNLTRICPHKIDVYCIQVYEPWYVRKLRHSKPIPKPEIIELDGIKYHMLYFRFWLTDYIVRQKLGGENYIFVHSLKKISSEFKDYNLILSHDYNAGILALFIKNLCGIPYMVTWHGSDIHSAPFSNKSVFKNTRKVLQYADMNIFVSKQLKIVSDKILSGNNKKAIYNGVDKDKFYKYSREKIQKYKTIYGLSQDDINIAFIGGLVEVKNVLALPDIFNIIKQSVSSANFHFIGDGKYRNELKSLCAKFNLNARFWGNRQPEEMPTIINCMDLVVLPSKNEGLPLICLETLACGVRMVGAKVGGIPEVLGNDFCVEHGDCFEERFAQCCINALYLGPQKLKSEFDWKISANSECEIIKQILKI